MKRRDKDFNRRLCAALKELRRTAGISQREMTDRMEFATARCVCLTEQGHVKMHVATLVSRCVALGVRPSDVVELAQ